MKKAILGILKYIDLYFTFIKNSFVREMQFKGNFLLMTVTTAFLNIYFLAFYLVLASITNNNFLGWNREELLFFLGSEVMCHSLFMAFCFFNVFSLPDKIRTGDFDFILIKPINSRFVLSTTQFDVSMFSQILFGIGLCVYSLVKLNINISIGKFLLYIVFIVNGVLTMYLIAFTLMSLSFYFVRVFSSGSSFPYRGFFALYWFARRPEDIYTGVLVKVLTYIFPLMLIVNLPAKLIVKSVGTSTIIWAFIITPIFFLFTHYLWKKGLKRYQSASS